MEKGAAVRFSDLQIGDYFSDDSGLKYRKIPPTEIWAWIDRFETFTAFDIQNNAYAIFPPDELVTFIKRSPWRDKEWIVFSFEELDLDHRLEFLFDYYETMESFLEAETQMYTEWLSQFPANYKPDFEQAYEIGGAVVKGDPVFDEIRELSSRLLQVDDFANLLRQSFFISLCAFLEARLNNECESRKKEDGTIKLALHDIYSKGINRAKTYLVKVLGGSFPFGRSAEWQEVQRYIKIRNCIVHKEGRITGDNKLKRYIDSKQNISYSSALGEDSVVLGKGFCNEALSTIGKLLRSMLYYRLADRIR